MPTLPPDSPRSPADTLAARLTRSAAVSARLNPESAPAIRERWLAYAGQLERDAARWRDGADPDMAEQLEAIAAEYRTAAETIA